jgi:predicted porin
MKKVLVPAALLLGMAGAAQAQVSLYGLLDASYGKSIGSDASGQREDFHSGGDADPFNGGSSQGNSTSRFGLKGSTDVGSGVKANFKLESNGIQSDGSIPSPFFARQAWVGLSGNFGEFRIGRQDNVAFQTAVDYDFNGASNGISSLYYAGVAPWNSNGRQSRLLSYYSPTFAGVKFVLGFVPNGNGGTSASATSQVDNTETYSAAVTYATGPLSVTANYETKRNTDFAHDFGSLVGSYDLGFAKVMLGYANGGANYDGFSTGLVAPIAGVNVGFMAGYNRDTDGYAVEVFANKEIFKNTIAYVEAGNASKKTSVGVTKGSDATGWAAGIIYLF